MLEMKYTPRTGLKQLKAEIKKAKGKVVRISTIEMDWVEVLVRYS